MLAKNEIKNSVKKLLRSLNDTEETKSIELFNEFDTIDMKRGLTKEQLLKILIWKSPRPSKHYKSNLEKDIKEITSLAFTAPNDKLKIHLLTALNGVSYPAASAILMFFDRTKFPVLDIRVWRQLYKLKLVRLNSRGQNFTLSQCEIYFQIIRQLADELDLTARQVEKRLFDHDKINQLGNLYDKNDNYPRITL